MTDWNAQDDPSEDVSAHRALENRRLAAQLLVHTIDSCAQGTQLVLDAVTSARSGEVFVALLNLVATYSPAEMVPRLQHEIASLTMVLEDDN